MTLALLAVLGGLAAIGYGAVVSNSKSSVAVTSATRIGNDITALALADNQNPRLGRDGGALGGYVSEVAAEVPNATVTRTSGFAPTGATATGHGKVSVVVNSTSACLELPSSPRSDFAVTAGSCGSVTPSVK